MTDRSPKLTTSTLVLGGVRVSSGVSKLFFCTVAISLPPFSVRVQSNKKLVSVRVQSNKKLARERNVDMKTTTYGKEKVLSVSILAKHLRYIRRNTDHK